MSGWWKFTIFPEPRGADLFLFEQRQTSTLTEDSEIRMSESSDVRQHSRQVRIAHAEPCRQRRGEFIHGCRRNPAALPGIVGTIDREGRESSKQSTALDGAAEDELMAAPAMIGARAVRGEGATKIRGGESSHILGDTQLNRRGIKCVQGLAQLRKQTGLAVS